MKTDLDKSPIFMRRIPQGLAPATAHDAERLDGIAFNSDVEVTIRQRRSLPLQRLYWVTLAEVVAATETYPTAEFLHDAIKMQLGYVRLMKRLDGTLIQIPDSTAFGAMDAAAFRKFFDAAMKLIAETFGFDPLTAQRAA